MLKKSFLILIFLAPALIAQQFVPLFKNELPSRLLEDKKVLRTVEPFLKKSASIHPDLLYWAILKLNYLYASKDEQSRLEEQINRLDQLEPFYKLQFELWKKKIMGKVINDSRSDDHAPTYFALLELLQFDAKFISEYKVNGAYKNIYSINALRNRLFHKNEQNKLHFIVYKYYAKDSTLNFNAQENWQLLRQFIEEQHFEEYNNIFARFQFVNDAAPHLTSQKLLHHWHLFEVSNLHNKAHHTALNLLLKLINQEYWARLKNRQIFMALSLNSGVIPHFKTPIKLSNSTTNGIEINEKYILFGLGLSIKFRPKTLGVFNRDFHFSLAWASGLMANNHSLDAQRFNSEYINYNSVGNIRSLNSYYYKNMQFEPTKFYQFTAHAAVDIMRLGNHMSFRGGALFLLQNGNGKLKYEYRHVNTEYIRLNDTWSQTANIDKGYVNVISPIKTHKTKFLPFLSVAYGLFDWAEMEFSFSPNFYHGELILFL